ncbi:PilZ domain-containing protein [uncultured Massilia sp.]|uniref:PilZ domain-containing protein n=1 Tax=uncultured Massilia sp. TaxID=169973 RepID=UPI0025F8FE5D|nr:PilZ domain-containing protein [uncultured Massilia sp.]
MVTDQRKTVRKILKVKAVVAMDGQAPLPARTSDIGSNGVSVTVAHPLQAGQAGQVSLDLLVDGKPTPLHARAKVMYCIFSGDEFKVGFQFMNLDLNAMSQLSRFLR